MLACDALRNAMQGLQRNQWDWDYGRFCEALSLKPDAANSKRKWKAFQQLSRAMFEFTPDQLSVLISKPKTDQP